MYHCGALPELAAGSDGRRRGGAEAQIVRAAAEEEEDSLAAHVLMSLLEGVAGAPASEDEDPDYSPQVPPPPCMHVQGLLPAALLDGAH